MIIETRKIRFDIASASLFLALFIIQRLQINKRIIGNWKIKIRIRSPVDKLVRSIDVQRFAYKLVALTCSAILAFTPLSPVFAQQPVFSSTSGVLINSATNESTKSATIISADTDDPIFQDIRDLLLIRQNINNTLIGSTASESSLLELLNHSTASAAIHTDRSVILERLPREELDVHDTSLPNQRISVYRPHQRMLQPNESIELFLSEGNTADLTVTLTHEEDGRLLPITTQEQQIGDETKLTIDPPRDFVPGNYVVTIADTKGIIATERFSWGVLVLNPNKATYRPGETAKIAIGVLDDKGEMVCDADVSLYITDPSGNVITRKTSDESIRINPSCNIHNVTTEPDYETAIPVNETGIYILTLQAVTDNGTKTITDFFDAVERSPFEIERKTATRIFPPKPYPVELIVTANQDFSGVIEEKVPADFVVLPPEKPLVPFESVTLAPDNSSIATASISLAYPFEGNRKIIKRFGEMLTDQNEIDLYREHTIVGHDGIDIAMVPGQEVKATDTGLVSFVGQTVYGLTVVIDHAWGRSYYGRLNQVTVNKNTQVTKGTVIALSGNSGLTNETPPHLHFGIRLQQYDEDNGFAGKIDPLPYMEVPFSTATQIVHWNVRLKKGDTIRLGYLAASLSTWATHLPGYRDTKCLAAIAIYRI